jgi:hypothetical protein
MSASFMSTPIKGKDTLRIVELSDYDTLSTVKIVADIKPHKSIET